MHQDFSVIEKKLGTRDHGIFTIDDMKSMQVVPKVNIANCCFKHRHEKVHLYCQDHEQPCCALFGGGGVQGIGNVIGSTL